MKKVFCTALLAVLLTVSAVAATPADFSDFPAPEHWAHGALTRGVENGLLNGRTADTLVPQGEMSRSEMATILNRAFGATVEADITGMTDVSPEAWYFHEMAKAAQMQTFQGTGGKTMEPERPITRQEAFTVFARALLLKLDPAAPGLQTYSDSDKIAAWAKPAVSAMVAAGYVEGYDGKLSPLAPITRAEFAQLMDKTVKHYLTETNVTTNWDGAVMVRQGTTFTDLTIDGNLIIGDGVGEAEIVLKNVKVAGKLIIRGGGEHSVRFVGNTTIGGEVACGKTTATLRIFTETTRPDLRVAGGSKNVIVDGKYRDILLEADHADVLAIGADMASGTITGNESRIVVKEASVLGKGKIYGDNSKIIVEKFAKLKNGTIFGKDSQIIIEVGGKLTDGNVEKEADRSKIVIVGGGTGSGKEDIIIKPGESTDIITKPGSGSPVLTADMVEQLTFTVGGPAVVSQSTSANRVKVEIDLTGCRPDQTITTGELDVDWFDNGFRTARLDP
ncbi:MAG: S-layer homology domain-containing protein, partial [Oscillospiraceae bacterium]